MHAVFAAMGCIAAAIIAFCHLRGELRSFMAGRIVAMMDMDQGRAWSRFVTIQGELRRRSGIGTATDRRFEDPKADREVFASLKAEIERQGATVASAG